MGLLQKIFGTHSENELKRIYPIVDEIEALGPQMEQLSDEELKNKTQEFKSRLKDTETLDDICRRRLQLCVRRQDVHLA